MGRRDGTIDERAWIAVSPEMVELRVHQRELNYFLWSTELSYGFVLTSEDRRLMNPDKSVSEALANVQASAWYRNNQGKLKYRAKTSSFLEQLARNPNYIFRAVTVFWCSYFESYLEKRVRPVVGHTGSWGPYTETLNYKEFVNAPTPIELQTVLRADFCRLVRNHMIHADSKMPGSVNDTQVQRWIGGRINSVKRSNSQWRCAEISKEVNAAARYVIGEVTNHLRQAERNNERGSLEQFYALFTLTNLDHLACEIEESLLPTSPLAEGRINREVKKIRRKDLIVTNPQAGEFTKAVNESNASRPC